MCSMLATQGPKMAAVIWCIGGVMCVNLTGLAKLYLANGVVVCQALVLQPICSTLKVFTHDYTATQVAPLSKIQTPCRQCVFQTLVLQPSS